jgi:hypothetical protein
MFRQELRPFSDKQIELVTSFARQAVIAIENARLLNELRQRTNDLSEALEQQTATSGGAARHLEFARRVELVFQSMLENGVRICEATFGDLYLCDGNVFRMVATHNSPPAYAAARTRDPLLRPPPDAPIGLVASTKQVAQIADITTIPSYVEGHPFVVAGVELAGYRTVLAVPMLKDNALIGHDMSSGSPAVRRQADRACEELRRAGRHRDREHSPPQRTARIPPATDCHSRRAQSHQPLNVRSQISTADVDRVGCSAL